MSQKIVSFKDLTCRRNISVSETGVFCIGLALDGSLVVEKDVEGLAVVLLQLSVQENGGNVLSPANKDLTCVINASEILTGETNLIDGMRIDIADKKLVFINGPIPKLRKKLPRTPGQPLVNLEPPAKPARTFAANTQAQEGDSLPTDNVNNADPDQVEQARWLEKSWCMLDLPVVEQEMFTGLDTPEKLGILAGSYFCKQVKIFTDAVISAQRLDDIFTMFLDTVDQCKDVFMDYLSDISALLEKVPDHSNTQPMHGPAIRFLTRLLTQSLDPVNRVVLILDLLRTFSHFDVNLSTMVRCQTTAAVLGSLAAFLDVVEVQQYVMDILAKIAVYRPKFDRKAPLRDAGIDLVVRGMNHHGRNLTLCRSGCRVLANLSSTLLSVLNQWLDEESPSNTTVCTAVDVNEALLVYVFEKGIPAVQMVLKDFRTDLGISTEGRRFIFYYAKLPQLQIKKSKWYKDYMAVNDQPDTEENDYHTGTESEFESSNQESFTESHDPSVNPAMFLRKTSVPEPEVQGILKNEGCYELNRVNEKRLLFADDTVGGSASDTDTCFSDSDLDLVKSFEESVKLDRDKKDIYTSKVQHVMRRTIKRRKSMRGEVNVVSDSDTEEDSVVDDEADGINSSCADPNLMVDKDNGVSRTDEASVSDTPVSTQCPLDVDPKSKRRLEHRFDVGPTSSQRSVISGTETEGKEHGISMSEQQNVPPEKPNMLEMNDRTTATTNEITKQSKNSDIRIVSIDDETVLIETESEQSELVSSLQKGGESSDDGKSSTVQSGGAMVLTSLPDRSQEGVEKPNNNHSSATAANNVNNKLKDETQVVKPDTGNIKHTDSAIDTHFFGKLVRTQIIIHVGSLVFQGEDSQVLMVIDQPIKPLLTSAGAQQEVIQFAGNQYGANMTLMELEPAIVINIIDAVRYRSVTKNLVQSSLLGLTRTINATLQQNTINTVMLFYKAVFADQHLQTVLTEEDFLKEFRTCFQNATERLERNHTLDEIRQRVTQKSFAV